MKNHRVASVVLLAGGVVLVFAGLASALGYSLSGMIASSAAILALLYAGGVWFGGTAPGDRSVLLFTQTLTVASGPFAGRPVANLFVETGRAGIEDGCRRALAGEASRFSCGSKPFVASPVRSAEGLILYGVLLSGAAAGSEAAGATVAI